MVKSSIRTIFGSSQHRHPVDQNGMGTRPGMRSYSVHRRGSDWGAGHYARRVWAMLHVAWTMRAAMQRGVRGVCVLVNASASRVPGRSVARPCAGLAAGLTWAGLPYSSTFKKKINLNQNNYLVIISINLKILFNLIYYN